MRTIQTIRDQKPKKADTAKSISKAKRSKSEEAKVSQKVKDAPPTFNGKNRVPPKAASKVADPKKGKKSRAPSEESKVAPAKMKKVSKSEEKVIEQKDKPYVMKPKRILSPYMFFVKDWIKNNKNTTTGAAMMVEASKVWAKYTDAQKKPFVKMSEDDAKRFEKQIKELETKGTFKNADGSDAFKSELDPRRKWGPNIMMPKRPSTAFVHYSKELTKSIMDKEKLKITEAAKKIAQMWKELPEKKIKLYEKKVEADKKRYEYQMAELIKNGYFTMADGTKSTDHSVKPVKKVEKAAKSDVSIKSQSSTKTALKSVKSNSNSQITKKTQK